MLVRRAFLGVACACAAAPLAFAQSAQSAPSPEGGKFVCPPCGCSQDGKDFDKPGICPDANCGMQLIPKPPPEPAKPSS